MKLLVFGGNGYIGGECVRYLLDHDHEITLLNRGHWPWDGEVRLKPRVRQIHCDRYDPTAASGSLAAALDGQRFDAIIDFSATETARVQPFYDLLKTKANLYVYISSDSCYEVCEKASSREGAAAASREEDAVRPSDIARRNELAEMDEYGHGKMCVEEFLVEESQKKGGIPYVFLRLPDVLGERDTTERWWKYQMWMEYQHVLGVPVLIPRFTEHLCSSYVDVLDVAAVVQLVLTSGDRARNRAFNVALADPMRLIDLLRVIRDASGAREAQLEFADDDHPIVSPSVLDAPTGALRVKGDYYFPSVTRGPVDVRKIERELGWVSTSKRDFETMRAPRIAQFYREAKKKFPVERTLAAESLLADLSSRLPTGAKEKFLRELEDES